jgi:DsbC/DsbD-like thiol-disulfide interchange protein
MHRFALTLAACAALALPAGASPPDDVITVEVLPGWDTADGTRMVGLRLTLAPGWKTYWRAPGAAGIPPLFDWAGSENIAGAALHWPVPHVFHLNGMRSIGYVDQVVIPVELTPGAPGAPMRVAGTIELGVCQEVCMPANLTFDLPLPADAGRRDPAIVAALVDRPHSGAEAGVGDAVPAADGLTLTARIAVPGIAGEEVVVIETADPVIWVSEAATVRDGDWLVAQAHLVARSGTIALDRSLIRITVLRDGQAIDLMGCTGS